MLYWHVQYADHQRRVISHEVDSLTGSPYVGAPHSPHPDPQPHSFHRTPLPPQHCVSDTQGHTVSYTSALVHLNVAVRGGSTNGSRLDRISHGQSITLSQA